MIILPAWVVVFAIRIGNAARQGNNLIVLQHVAVQRIDGGIVNVGREHTLAQIIEDNYPAHPTEPAEGLFVQLCPDLELERNNSKRMDLRL